MTELTDALDELKVLEQYDEGVQMVWDAGITDMEKAGMLEQWKMYKRECLDEMKKNDFDEDMFTI